MKLTIFGATSATGKHLVEMALQTGHEVTAFVRDETKLTIKHERLKVLRGNALDPAQVEHALQESDAVLSTLGPKGKPAVMAAESTKNIVNAMQRHGVRRLVLVSVAGVPVPQDKRGFNLADAFVKLFLKDMFSDRENQLAVLNSSGVDWVAVRVPRLTDDPATGSVRAFFGNPSPSMKVSRVDVADFMLKQLTDTKWLAQAPIISNG